MSHTLETKRPASESAIAALAKEAAAPTDLVRTLYEKEVAALSKRATIHQYVGVIAARIVRQRLKALHALH